MNKLIAAFAVAVLAACAPTWAVVPSDVSHVEIVAPGAGDNTFDFTFKTLAASHIVVKVGGVVQQAGYTVVLSADQTASPGGTVTFTVAPLTGAVVRIERVVPLTQTAPWTPYSAFKANALASAFDLSAMRDQQLQRQIDDALDGVQGAQGVQGPQGVTGSISAIGSNLDFVSTWRGTNLAAPVNPNDTARLAEVTAAQAAATAYTDAQMPFARKTADQTNATTSYADITDLPFAVEANKDYEFEVFLLCESAAPATVGIGVAVVGPAAPTASSFLMRIPIDGPTYVDAIKTLGSGSVMTSAPLGKFPVTIHGLVRNGANAGFVKVQFSSEVGGTTATIYAGSFVKWRKLN
jgi:hypothetical protein